MHAGYDGKMVMFNLLEKDWALLCFATFIRFHNQIYSLENNK